MSAFNKHPYKTVKEIFVDKLFKTQEYTASQLSDIAEDVFSKWIKLWDAVLTHKISIERIREIISLRKKVGHKLDEATVLSRLKWAEAIEGTEFSKSSNDLGDNIKLTKNSVVCLSKNLSQTEVDRVREQPRLFGKAQAYPRSFSAKKIHRNKSIVDAAKQQERIKARIEAAQSSLEFQQQEDSIYADVVLSSKKEGKYCVPPKGKPASKLPDAKGKYIPSGLSKKSL